MFMKKTTRFSFHLISPKEKINEKPCLFTQSISTLPGMYLAAARVQSVTLRREHGIIATR